MSSKSNGGFPPLRIIKEDKKNHKKTKLIIKEVPIKQILSESIVKPMIDLNKPKYDIVIDSL